ncbi:hypothetical protein DICPUDRAFT_99900 [Dictyostelium purpureum]|uniref:J domain-containing protein n=1 Tax=Dictyostelium purpureum TaxID=5786 RepID=F1A3L2_DICPU|nr:uncharacterized protein DICPUDRAFT_99900 [Dictyostelium purpureum]EGC29219.1 hypothetical protein DICPUDRAFT_99900 [Dictyostelium purpureum]|eukprot:XP_003294255.1 hypothetical protein DICPUDRAFT_99900 [Dictyostelium purpureum]
MESNREESIRCIEIALNKYKEGNLEGCIKFLNKSNSLYPNERARELLATYSSSTTSSSSTTTQKETDGSSTTTTTTTTSSKTTQTTETINEPAKPKYTAEQVAAIKRIRACKSFYEVLEIPKTATENEIKKAYRKLALQMHPDKNHAPGSDDAFKIVTQAFSCLSDSNKRQTYDLHGSEDTPINRSPFTRGGGVYYDDEFSPEDIFNMFFGVQPNVRNRRAGGNNYYYSSSPFGSGVQFNFGGPPRRRPAAHHHQPQQQESGYSLLLILIPLLLFILSLFAGGGSSYNNSNTYSSLYQFTETQSFNRERVIVVPIDLAQDSKIDIQYFVKSDFDRAVKHYGIDMQKFESDVVNKWVVFKEPYCKRKEELDEIIKKNPSDTNLHQTIKKELKKYDFVFKYCDQLNKNKVFK